MGHAVLILAAVCAAAAVGGSCRWYYERRERQLFDRLEEMIRQARQGELDRTEISEDMISVVENSLKRFLEDSQISVESQKRQKDLVQGLISDIAHQTLTPISNLKMYAELLEEADTKDPDLVDTLKGQADRLDFLIRSLVKLSRMESGIIHVKPCVAAVSGLLERIRQDYAGQACENGVDLHIGRTDLEAVFDMKWTQEAVGNLVDNALKYTPAGGRVEIRAEAYPFFIRLDIRDTGIGIPEGELCKIFGRFYRGMAVQEQPGVGIGLYLAREMIQAQKGYIKDSSEVGTGSVFSVFLPSAGSGRLQKVSEV